MDYESFLKEKIKFVKYDGFTVEQSALNDKLKPHQKDIDPDDVKKRYKATDVAKRKLAEIAEERATLQTLA